MGSSKPPNQQEMPFGYSFDAVDSGFPFPSPPAPAPGPSLLDDHESKLLDSFFDGVSSDQFNGDFFSGADDGLDHMGFGWQDIPPAFMGTTSSFGQQPPTLSTDPSQGLTYADMNRHDHIGLSSSGAADHLTPTTSPDVLAAAVLLQNGHNHRVHGMGNQNSLFPVPGPSRNVPTSVMMPYNEQHHSRPLSIKPDDYARDNLYADLMFGSPADHGRKEHKESSKPIEIRWGSDAGFGSGQGFIPPPGQETVEALEQNKMSSLDCFEPHSSTAASTRPSSPVVTRQPHLQRKLSNAIIEKDKGVAEDNSRPRKRRKNKIKVEEREVEAAAAAAEEDEDENEVASKAPPKQRPKSTAAPTVPAETESPTPSKRRKSVVSSTAKPSRENLTEDQKRENHIKSEQKRRTLIKEGFDDLGELVPDLRSGGFSKSAILVMAGDFLEDLIKGNQSLNARLHELERR
ncbi:MAG: hypothetical protein M1818_005105 [Claussenomyces sp. TS43310]|nr:MAG: hypothetical protein M1818_005105 [Claussenomyces sp. TS43310]